MYGFIFKNKLGALAFVAMTLYGVASLVGSEDDEGLLQRGVETIQTERGLFEEQIGEFGDPEPEEIIDDGDDSEELSLPFGPQLSEDDGTEFGLDLNPEEYSRPQLEAGPPAASTLPSRASGSSSKGGMPQSPGEIVGFVVDGDGNVVMNGGDDR